MAEEKRWKKITEKKTKKNKKGIRRGSCGKMVKDNTIKYRGQSYGIEGVNEIRRARKKWRKRVKEGLEVV